MAGQTVAGRGGFRFDVRPSDVETVARRSRFAARHDERRRALRYPSVMGRAWLGWKDGGEFSCRAAWVIDISSGGCLVASDGEPPADVTVYLRLVGPQLARWFEARVREIRAGEANVCSVRLLFPEGCPYDLFMGLAYGRYATGPDAGQ